MKPQADPVHDRVQLSASELRAIAELEEHADELAPATGESAIAEHRRLRIVLLVLGRALLWLAVPALALVISPVPLGWRVTGALVLFGSTIAGVAWLVRNVRARRNRRS